jgi:hypothetical protein
MKNKLLVLISIAFFSNYTHAVAQFEPDSLTKNSVGISLRQFVNVVFKSPTSSTDILYSRKLNNSNSLRAGFTIQTSTDDADLNLYGIGIGGIRVFKNDAKWKFYYGIDLFYKYSYQKNQPTTYHEYSSTPFIGISYTITKRITFATEPGLFFEYLTHHDPSAFAKVPNVFRIGMANIGHVRLDFNF